MSRAVLDKLEVEILVLYLQINAEPNCVAVSHPRFVGGDEESDPPLDAATHAEPDEDADGDAEAEHDSRIHGGQDAQASGVNE